MSVPLIGRGDELQTLHRVVAEVASGSPGAVLLTGPPGVGKTRLAQEALALADASGFSTFVGRAHALDREVAFAPLVVALDTALRNAPEDRLAMLAGDLPQLAVLFSGLKLPVPVPLHDPGLERARLLNALSQLIDRLARERPLAMLVDDVHLADSSTSAFLQYLVDVLTDRGVLLVLTARARGPEAQGVRALTRSLDQSTWALERIVVDRLTDDAAAELVESVLHRPADARLTASIADRCGGRPLFIEAVTRTLSENGRLVTVDGVIRATHPDLPLPEIVRDQLHIRLAGLDAHERAVLDSLAVSDGGLDYALLAQTVSLPPDELLTALDGLHERALLAPSRPSATYDVVHGLLRDTLLADRSPATLARLHARLARALIDENVQHQRTAEHVLLAHGLIEPADALDPLIRGATQSAALGASGTAGRYLRAAVDAAERLGRQTQVAELKARLATALQLGADRRAAQTAWTDAQHSFDLLGDDLGVSRAEQQLGMLAWSDGDLERARRHFEAAEHRLDGMEPSAAHARLMFNTVVMASRVGDAEEVARVAGGLRELSDTLQSPDITAQALLAEAVLDYAATDYDRMVATNVSALAAARRADDPLLALRATDQLSVAYASQLDIPQLRRTTAQSLDIAGQLGSSALAGWPRCRMAVADLLSGDWDSALRNSTEMCDLTRRFAERRGSVSALATHAWILVHRGRFADAEEYLATARQRATTMLEADRNIFSIVAIAGTASALERGVPSEAADRAAQLENASGGWLPLLGLALLGEARARSGDLEGATSTVVRLHAIRSCSTAAPAALAAWVRGTIADEEGDDATAAAQFVAAAAAFDELGMPCYRARAELGAATATAGIDRAAAAARAEEALATFDRLGAPAPAQNARTLLRTLGITPTGSRRGRTVEGGLSPRELEVARLVASGMTNAEVATHLFISPRTVTTHLDRIYSKLTLTSRVALTRYLADSGLLDPDTDTHPLPDTNT